MASASSRGGGRRRIRSPRPGATTGRRLPWQARATCRRPGSQGIVVFADIFNTVFTAFRHARVPKGCGQPSTWPARYWPIRAALPSTAMMRSIGQPARTRPRARAELRRGAAPRLSGSSQRPKKTAASAAMPLSTPDRDLRIILAVVCYSFSSPTCGLVSQKRHRRVVLMRDRARGARCDGQENNAV